MDKIPQSHGGALLPGGKKGHRGGRGTIKSSVRALCRKGFEESVPGLIEIAKGAVSKGAPPTYNERIKAIDVLGKFGLGELNAVTVENGDVARAALALVAEMYGPDRLQEFADELITRCVNLTLEDADDESDNRGPALDPDF